MGAQGLGLAIRPRYRLLLNALSTFPLLLFLYYNNPLLDRNADQFPSQLASLGGVSESISHGDELRGRSTAEIGPDSLGVAATDSMADHDLGVENRSMCAGIFDRVRYASPCHYLKSHPGCTSGGFFEYVRFFYCTCEPIPIVAYVVLAFWLVALFYVLGNTAADYFCCCLEMLSELLRLPPTVAGVTLLPLGNGAPDVFASIAAFVGKNAGEVGLNSVLGGAVFVTSVVVGVVSLCVADKKVQIDKKCFIRDVVFFLLTLLALAFILIVGRVSVLGAVAFMLIYVTYALVVAANEFLRKHAQRLKIDAVTPLLPVRGSVFSEGVEDDGSMYSPLLDAEDRTEGPHIISTLPQWMWASNVAIYSNQSPKVLGTENPPPSWGWDDGGEFDDTSSTCSKVFQIVELPLTIPRRLTIPIVEEERWSKGYGVASACLAPLLLAFLWNRGDQGSHFGVAVYFVGSLIGAILGFLSYFYTKSDHPPRSFLFPWVFGGFLMSIIWFYIVANELVALLVTLGVVLGINPSVLGLTVLAWGNSMGDLMSNSVLAMSGDGGVQIAMSGSYAGPMFNTLVGLGISLLIGAWSGSTTSFAIPKDNSLFYTLGFLVSGLVWALIILPRNDMRPSKTLGIGLITLYMIFLTIRVCSLLKFFSLVGLS